MLSAMVDKEFCICNALTPQIKGILGYAYLILPCGHGIIFIMPCSVCFIKAQTEIDYGNKLILMWLLLQI